jgi:hypothetical protein
MAEVLGLEIKVDEDGRVTVGRPQREREYGRIVEPPDPGPLQIEAEANALVERIAADLREPSGPQRGEPPA